MAYYDVVDGLSPTFWWRLDGDETDSADSLNSDAGYDPSWVNSIIPALDGIAECGDYDGSTDETQLPNNSLTNSSTTTQKTISLWFYADTLDGTGRVLWGEGGSQNGLTLHVKTGTLYFNVYESTKRDTLSASISTGTLYHVLAVMNATNGNMYLWVNGSLEDSKTGGLAISTTFSSHSAGTAIGGADSTLKDEAGSSMSGNFDGRIADVAYWAEVTPLDGDDAAAIYVAGIGVSEVEITLDLAAGADSGNAPVFTVDPALTVDPAVGTDAGTAPTFVTESAFTVALVTETDGGSEPMFITEPVFILDLADEADPAAAATITPEPALAPSVATETDGGTAPVLTVDSVFTVGLAVEADSGSVPAFTSEPVFTVEAATETGGVAAPVFTSEQALTVTVATEFATAAGVTLGALPGVYLDADLADLADTASTVTFSAEQALVVSLAVAPETGTDPQFISDPAFGVDAASTTVVAASVSLGSEPVFVPAAATESATSNESVFATESVLSVTTSTEAATAVDAGFEATFPDTYLEPDVAVVSDVGADPQFVTEPAFTVGVATTIDTAATLSLVTEPVLTVDAAATTSSGGTVILEAETIVLTTLPVFGTVDTVSLARLRAAGTVATAQTIGWATLRPATSRTAGTTGNL